MNLYIWGDSGRVSYGTDSVVVAAASLREARKIAKKCADWSFGREHGNNHKDVSHITDSKPHKVIRNRAYGAYFMTCE